MKAKTLVRGLAAADSSGLIEYRQVLGQLYERAEYALHDAPPAPATGPTPAVVQPGWHASCQRRLKTDVAAVLGQQPKATAASAATVQTPQERVEASQPATGKKIQGLKKAGNEEGKSAAYWFADQSGTHGKDDAGGTCSGKERMEHAGPEGAGEGGGLWFGASGGDGRSLKEMADWRPTKDASILNDLNKERRHMKEAAGEGEARREPPHEEQQKGRMSKPDLAA